MRAPRIRCRDLGWFANKLSDTAPGSCLAANSPRSTALRENPHQARRSVAPRAAGVAAARQAQGKQLSYSNLNDTTRPTVCRGFDPNHGAAVASSSTPIRARGRRRRPARRLPQGTALRSDLGIRWRRRGGRSTPSSAASPDLHRGHHRARWPTRRSDRGAKNLRLLLAGGRCPARRGLREIGCGGLLVQSRDNAVIDGCGSRPSPGARPTAAELDDLRFAFASPSTSSRTPSSMPRTAPRSGSGPGR